MIMLALMAAISPVYLLCSFGSGADARTFDIAIDEANQNVAIGYGGRDIATKGAVFTPTKVMVTEPFGNETKTWIFDRVNLTVQTTTSFTANPENGVCKLQQAPAKRAF